MLIISDAGIAFPVSCVWSLDNKGNTSTKADGFICVSGFMETIRILISKAMNESMESSQASEFERLQKLIKSSTSENRVCVIYMCL